MPPQTHPKTLVLGLGNVLMTDDGVGVHAVRALVDEGWTPEQCIEVGTAMMKAQALLEQADTIIAIDAINAQDKPGTVYCMDMDDVALSKRETLHDLSLSGLMQLIPEDQRPQIKVVGIEPACLDYGMDLSPIVTASMPSLLKHVKQLLNPTIE